MAFVSYAYYHSNIYRIINGVDRCGNICGMKNDENTLNYCGDNNKEEYPYYFEPNLSCENDPINRGRSDESLFLKLSHSSSAIVIACFVALVFSCIFLVLVRYYAKYVVWTCAIGFVIFLIICTIALFVASVDAGEDSSFYVYCGIFFGVFALLAVCLIIIIRKRIDLVIELFTEASKALSDIPSIIIEPFLTFIVFVLSFVAFFYFVFVTTSSGKLTIVNGPDGNFLEAAYKQDIAMVIASWLNILAIIWFTEFIFGCQHFVIARTICQWYFARTKTKLESPTQRSFSDLIHFHLGSICFGSILMTIVKIIRMIVQGIRRSLRNSNNVGAKLVAYLCDCITGLLEELFQFFVRNAYIVVALEGTPFLDSGKRAYHLIVDNLSNVIALNKISDYVLFMIRLFVVLIAGFVGYALASKDDNIDPLPPTIVCVILAYIIIDSFVTAFDMTLDTILICFCVDCEQNDGTTRPYFMSDELMAVMKQVKKATGEENFNFGTFKDVEAGTSQQIMPFDGTSNKLAPHANVDTETQAMMLQRRSAD